MLVVLLVVFMAVLGLMVAAVVLGILFMRLPSSEPRTASWRQVAKKLRAEISTRGWWRSTPVLRFEYREARGTVCVKSRRGAEWTRFELRHSTLNLPVSISSSPMSDQLDEGPDAEPLPLLDDLRAAGWTAWSTDAKVANRRLTPVVQSQLGQLQQAVRPYQVSCRCGRSLLQVDVDHPLWSYDALHQLIRTGQAIYDQFLLALADGIDFVEPEVLQPLEAVRCRVCGESIEHDLVSCRACKTPHHLECWEYVGQCSTYACGETAYVMPQTGIVPRPRASDDVR